MNSNNVPSKYDSQVSVKMPSELLDVLKEIEEKHGINPADALRRCAEGIASFYQQHGFFAVPVHIEPEASFLQRAKRYKSVIEATDAGLSQVAGKDTEGKPKRKTA